MWSYELFFAGFVLRQARIPSGVGKNKVIYRSDTPALFPEYDYEKMCRFLRALEPVCVKIPGAMMFWILNDD